MVHRSFLQLKRVRIVIPQLSPTLTKAKIHKWLKGPTDKIECYEPLFVLKCSPDLLSPGYRKHENHEPLMLIEAHEDGKLEISPEILKSNGGEWFPVGHFVGTIDDGDEDEANEEDDAEWLWQAYSFQDETEEGTSGTETPTKRIDRMAYYAPLGVIELKGLLRNRGLDVSGTTREELIARLVESDNDIA